MSNKTHNEFEKAALDRAGTGIVSEFWHFVRQNRKWWLLPPLVILLLVGMMLVLSGTAVAPFIYTLF